MKQNNIGIVGLAVAFLFLGFYTQAWGQAPGVGVGAVGGELHGPMVVEGRILCVNCSREEVHKTQPNLLNLYEFSHGQEHLVMKVDEASNAARWEAIVGLSHEVVLRGKDKIWQTLTAEENLFRKVELTGVLSSTRTLDVGEVKVGGIKVSALDPASAREQSLPAQD